MEVWKIPGQRLLLAVLLPLAACGVQALLWDGFIKPYVWFLFFPAAFFSAWVGGLRGGLASTILSAGLVWYVFIPPRFAWAGKTFSATASVVLFLVMGAMFAWLFERLNRSARHTAEALKATEQARQEVTRLYEKTLELDTLKSQFFANVSHELRTPLTLIMAPLERRLAAEGIDEAFRRELEMMLRNARLLYRHVCDLLDAAKLEDNNMELAYSRFDLAQLVRTIAAHFESLAADRTIHYEIKAADPLLIEADGEKLERILLNLLSNAFKFTPNGGRVELSVRAVEGDALLEVRDSGPGVPTALREAVFERFRQVDGGAQRRHGGTGLGLAIVKEFAQLHHGKAWVTDAPSVGALFSVRIPLTAPEGTTVQSRPVGGDAVLEQEAVEGLTHYLPPAAPHPMPAGGAPLILVVEDNPDMSEFLVSVLKEHYRVACANDGAAGLEKARNLKPDLILSDVMMPGMSGDEMVLALREDPRFADVPVVMLTAKADDALRLSMFKAGVQAFLPKPFSVDELQARVGHLLSGRQRAQLQQKRSQQEMNRLQVDLTQLRFALDKVSNYVFIKDRNLRYIYANQLTLDLFGCTMDELVGQNDDPFFPPEAVERIHAIDRRALAGENTLEEVPIPQEGGGIRWFLDAKSPIYSPDDPDRPIALMGITADISDRVRADEEIRRLNTDLERRVVERTAELTAANDELEAFAYSVSHDLRAPLRAMSGFVTALEEDYADQLKGEAHLFLQEVLTASTRMGALIDGILRLSRCTRGDLQREPVDLSVLAEEILHQLQKTEPHRKVSWQIAPGLIAQADRVMLGVVLQNLIGNAWKYTGGNPEAHIRIYANQQTAIPSFCVADNGAGFDMKHASHLFKPFQRLHRQDEFPGIGIGLASVQRIVHRHGGRITATAEPGKGATFSFTLSTEAAERTQNKVETMQEAL